MAKREDINNYVDRNGHYHFCGYAPKDLIAAGYSGERVQSLNTSDYALAVERRDKQRVRHKQWIAEKRAQRDGRYLILDDLSDDQILGLARDAYRILFPSIEEHRVAQASRTATQRGAAIKAEQMVLASLETGAIEGSEPFGAFEYYTDKVLRNRMIRIQSRHAYSRLVLRVGDALIQIKREQIAAMQGKPGTEDTHQEQGRHPRQPARQGKVVSGRAWALVGMWPETAIRICADLLDAGETP